MIHSGASQCSTKGYGLGLESLIVVLRGEPYTGAVTCLSHPPEHDGGAFKRGGETRD